MIFSKLFASASFVAFFLSCTVEMSAFHYWILAALLFSLCGDLLLAVRGARRWFMLGIVAFALAHVSYCVGFAKLAIKDSLLAVTSAAAIVFAMVVYRWLRPFLEAQFRLLVPLYIVIICTMLALGVAAGISTGVTAVVAGTMLFAISDLFVARHRFIESALANRLIGLPLYYAAQLLLAAGLATLSVSHPA